MIVYVFVLYTCVVTLFVTYFISVVIFYNTAGHLPAMIFTLQQLLPLVLHTLGILQ